MNMACSCGQRFKPVYKRCFDHRDCEETHPDYKGCIFVAHFVCACGVTRTQRKRLSASRKSKREENLKEKA